MFIKNENISDFFELKKIKDLFKISNGKSQKDVENPNGYIPIYGSGGLIGKADKSLNDGNSFIIGRKGTIDNPLFIQEPYWSIDTAFNTSDFKINPFYCFLLFKKIDISKYKSGAVLPSLTQSDLNEIELLVPKDLKYCDSIVDFHNQQQGLIDSYKEKLSLLEEQEAYYQDELLSGRLRIRLTDESINYATQQGWYLNDDLVEGKEKEFEEWIAVDFHSKVEFYKETDFIDITYNEENKNIPKDWNILKIKDIEGIVIQNGYAFKKADMLKNESSYLIKIGNIQSNKIVLKEDTQMVKEIDEKFKLKKGDVVIGLSGANAGKMGIFDLEEDCFLNQRNVFIRISNNDFLINSFEYNVKKPILKFIKSMGIPNISSNDILNIDIAFPQKKKEAVLINYLTNIFSIQKINIQEKIKVEEEKMDYLMDELLSGRIRVK
jgi:restriction endonuclease S subunit